MCERRLIVLVLLLPLLGCPRSRCVEGEFEPRMYHRHVSVGLERLCYTVFVPDDYDPSHAWPLLLYWHGIDQAGNDGLEPLSQGLGPVLRQRPELYPCIVAIPQLPSLITGVGKGNEIYNAVLADVQDQYTIDPERLYVTGASSGSSRALLYVAATPDIFAALIPAAGPVPTAVAPLLTDLPILMYHGTFDPSISVNRSRSLRDAILEAGGDAELREIPGANHEIFFDVYSDPELISWLFSKRLH